MPNSHMIPHEYSTEAERFMQGLEERMPQPSPSPLFVQIKLGREKKHILTRRAVGFLGCV